MNNEIEEKIKETEAAINEILSKFFADTGCVVINIRIDQGAHIKIATVDY